MILVVDNYDSFTWNLVHYLREIGAEVRVERNDALTAAEALASGAEAILISPGPGTPDEAGISLELVAACAEARLPLLGVCLGHQAIGQHFGGRVARAPAPMHGKVSAIAHDGSGVFAGLPSPFDGDPLSFSLTRRARRPARLPDRQCPRRGRHRPGLPPREPADPRRPVPPGEHRQRARPCPARQFPGAREGRPERAALLDSCP